jgi:hypothetical protein
MPAATQAELKPHSLPIIPFVTRARRRCDGAVPRRNRAWAMTSSALNIAKYMYYIYIPYLLYVVY